MSNNSSPLKVGINNLNQSEKEITFNNNKSPSEDEDKHPFNSRNAKQNNIQDNIFSKEIIPEDKIQNRLYNTYNPKEEKKEDEDISNNFYSLNHNNSLFNEPQSESVIIHDNNNSDKMSISELNNINKNSKDMENNNNINIEENFDNDNENNDSNNNNDNNDNIENNDNADNINNNDNNDNNDDNDNNEYNDYNNNDYIEIEGDNFEEKKNDTEQKNEEEKLEEFLIENNNKNILSQKANEYLLFDMNNTINSDDKDKINLNINEKQSEENERNFFSKILDIEILVDSSEIYNKPWSQLINNIYNRCESNNDSIQLISLGSQHTLCISNKGKLYSFGWNNYCQCGIRTKKNLNNANTDFEIEKIEELNEIKIDEKINDISAGEDHSLIISERGLLYGFGLNNNGQLCYDPNKHKIIKKPSIIKSFKKCFITNVQCTDSISFILNDKGEAFICPWEDKQNQLHYIPIKLFFPLRPKIISISCGDNFTIFLSEKGNVYSMGSNNKFGQLGLGDTNMSLPPKLITYFKNNKIKISQISCGYSHVLALSEKGDVYSWGFGGDGQLGLGEEISMHYSPKMIAFFKNNKIIIYQVSSGYHCSYFLTDQNNIYICGTNGRDCNKDYIPKLIDVKIRYKDLMKYPCWICRILNCWNRSISIFYAIFLDCHFINKDDKEVNKILSLISKKWVHQSFSSSIMQGIDSMNYI